MLIFSLLAKSLHQNEIIMFPKISVFCDRSFTKMKFLTLIHYLYPQRSFLRLNGRLGLRLFCLNSKKIDSGVWVNRTFLWNKIPRIFSKFSDEKNENNLKKHFCQNVRFTRTLCNYNKTFVFTSFFYCEYVCLI